MAVSTTTSSITQLVDTFTSSAADTLTKNAANLVSDSDNKVLEACFRRGRVIPVDNSEKVSHFVLHGSNEATTRFNPNTIAGTAGSLGTASFEALNKVHSTMLASTFNVNFPQADSGDDLISSVAARMDVAFSQILDEEENLFLRGEITASGTEVTKDCYSADTHYANSLPMSVLGLLGTGVATTSEKFGNLTTAAFPQWTPRLTNSTSAAGADLLEDIDKAVSLASYNSMEKPDFGLTTFNVYNELKVLLRAKSTINDKILADLGTTDGVPVAGMMFTWSRRLAKDALWDITAETTPENPIFGLNLKSLRLNMSIGGGVIGSGMAPGLRTASWLAPVGQTQVHAQLTNLFRRFQYCRNWSVEHGRRSMFQIEGTTL
jgi:hypothetical protein